MEFKVISLNVWQGGNLFNEIIGFLKKEDADVLALQEVYDGKDSALPEKYRTFEALKAKLDYPYSSFAPALLDNRAEGKIEQGNAVFSRFPIISTDTNFFKYPYREDYTEVEENFPICPRNLQHAQLQLPTHQVNLFNFQGVWDMNGDRDSEERRIMVDVILKNIKGKQNVIVTGDTNARPTNPAMKPLLSELVSVFGNGELTSTFNMRHKTNPGFATSVVDMMLVSKSFDILKKEISDADVSDHVPLVVTLKLK